MIKSKHFRKDVIIARVIVLALCALIIAGIVWVVSLFTGPEQQPGGPSSEKESSEDIGESESESDSEPESVTEPDTEPETESETDTELPPEEPESIWVKVTSKSNLNLRKEPNTTALVLTSLPNGTKVEVIEELDGWYKVTYKGHTGYISSKYVRVVEE
jgi:uncharacterized protein YgiM (DUF1202 family)